ncbi:MAG: chromate transporter [Alphaproteobacteria bacterium]|nr:chromate transporter [Alphaproteobacteria bacterium]
MDDRGGASPVEIPSAGAPSAGLIFLAFLSTAAVGFGGVLPWARRMIVERRRWLSAEEFNNLLALCQFLPGSNVVNLAVAVGARFRGLLGALAAFTGIMAVPTLLVMGVGALYLRFGGIPVVRGALQGIAASAAGLVVATAAKMAVPLLRRRPAQALPFMLAAFAAVGLLRVPLEWAVLALCPLSIAASWRWPR